MIFPSIPAPSALRFREGIVHPDLHLWDAWSYTESGEFHLYSLAVDRLDPDGSPLPPTERNDFPFHIRHFLSRDRGETWTDRGCLLAPRRGKALADSRTVWSGSIEALADGSKLLAYTGLCDRDEDHCFVQSLMLALTDGDSVIWRPDAPLLSPLRDREAIVAAGYYLAAAADIGHREGEDGGPVMAWRDPFIFIDEQGRIHLFWSAKVAPRQAAMGHALLRRDSDGFGVETLFPPTVFPDGQNFTQFELPKIYRNKSNGRYYLIASTCNRTDERQRDGEVDKRIRLYQSETLDGPWRSWGSGGSALPGLDDLFGMTVLEADFVHGNLLCMAPYTDAAGPALGLTFAAPFRITLDYSEAPMA